MSWQATTWAVQQQAGSPGVKLVLMLLADRADERGSCWPSQERLAEESEQSVATVRRQIRKLEELGLLTTHRRTVPGRKRATNRYYLAVCSTAQDERQTESEDVSTAQPDDLPLTEDDFYRSTVSAEQPLEPSLTEPSVRTTRTAAFTEFWKAYPRKKDKGHAEKAFHKAVKHTDPAVIVAGAVQFRQWCEQDRTDPQFIPHASTWLNGKRWDDERDPEPLTNSQAHIALVESLCEDGNGYPQPDTLQLEG